MEEQLQKLKASSFEAGPELCQYVEMLPSKSELCTRYEVMPGAQPPQKKQVQHYLRAHVVAVAIDVTMMTKVDKDNRKSKTFRRMPIVQTKHYWRLNDFGRLF